MANEKNLMILLSAILGFRLLFEDENLWNLLSPKNIFFIILVEINDARLGLLAHNLQHRPDDLELLATRIAGIFILPHHLIVFEKMKIVNTFLVSLQYIINWLRQP